MPYSNPERQKEAQAKHYQENKGLYRDRDRKRKQETREWYAKLKSTFKCIECGEAHPACLTFHHRDPKGKEGTIATAISNRWSKDRILAEIAKCDVLCSNCHLKVHWAEQSQYQKVLNDVG